jgi:hypothetical protein
MTPSALRKVPHERPFPQWCIVAATSIHALARQWHDLTRQIDDNDAYRQAELADPSRGGDKRADRLWTERESIAAKILANAEPTIAGIAAKLRMLAWHMNVEHAMRQRRWRAHQ